MAALWELFVRISGDNSNFKQSIKESQDATERFGSMFSALDSKLGAAVGFGAIGVGALAAANKFDQANAQIARATGATGEKLTALNASMVNVYKQTTASSEQVSAALSLLSTRTQATGKDLEDLTLKTIKLAKTQNEDVGQIVPLVTRAFGDWSIATNMQGQKMDYLRVVSQQTGTQVSKLVEQVVYAGAPLRQLGYNFESAVALIGKFEKEGVNTELVLGGMKAALQKFAKEGIKDTAAEWQKFVEGVQNGSITFKQVAEEVGAKRAVDLYKAIQEGRFEIDKMVDSSKRLAKDGGDAIDTYKGKFTKLQHAIEAFFSDHKDLIIGVSFAWPIVSTLGSTLLNLITGAVSALGLTFTAGAIIIPVTLAIGGYLLGDAMQKKFAPGGNTTQYNPGQWSVVGHDVVPTSQARTGGVSGAIIDFVNGLGGSKTPPPDAPHVLDDKEIKDLFSALDALNSASSSHGLKNLKDDLAKGLDAFHQLASAGLLTHDQMLKAAAAIHKVRDELDGIKPKLDLVNITPAGPSIDDLRALPTVVQSGDIENLVTYDRNLQLLNDTLAASVTEALRAQRDVEALTDAYHYFGQNTPEELQQFAQDAEDAFKLIRESAGDNAQATKQAWEDAFRARLKYQLATGKITPRESSKILGELDEKGLNGFGKKIKDTERDVHQFFRSMSSGIVDAIKQWHGFADGISSVFKKMGEALFEIIFNRLMKPVEDFFTDVITELFSKTATQAAATKAATSALNTATVASDAAVASAATFASIAAIPIVGPALAPAAAAASYAQVMAMAPLAMFEKGGDVPYDMPAFLHKKEMVLPADIAVGMRKIIAEGGAGNSPDRGGVHFHNCSFGQGSMNTVVRQLRLAGARI